MTKEWYASHPQDVHDIATELKGFKLPYVLMKVSQRARDGTEGDKWSRLNSFLHRGVIPVFSEITGYMEDEAKRMLQIRFALVEEREDDYLVESVGGMSANRLIKFIDDCQMFMVMNLGVKADEMLTENRVKYLKTKIIKK
jgi:hypothetical protein